MTSILDKLRKLKAMAVSAEKVGNEAEAQAFANMVQTLLAKHKLDASDVEWEEQQNAPLFRGIIRVKSRVNGRLHPWEKGLATIVTVNCGVRLAVATNQTELGNPFWVIGFEPDVRGAVDTYDYMHAAASHLAEIEYVRFYHEMKRAGDVTMARGYKASWLFGFITRLEERYEENKAAILRGIPITAMVRVTNAIARIDQQLNATVTKQEVTVKPPNNIMGYLEGRQAAEKVRLSDDSAGQLPA
jgi:hypothetical protein